MASKKRNPSPIIIEQHPAAYKGYPFLTLIQYRKDHILLIIDNMDDDTITGYELDKCGPEQINESVVLDVANYWYEHARSRYPLSFEFSKRNLNHIGQKIYRTYNTSFVTRIVGPVFTFEMNKVFSTRKRRRRNIPSGVEIEGLFKY